MLPPCLVRRLLWEWCGFLGWELLDEGGDELVLQCRVKRRLDEKLRVDGRRVSRRREFERDRRWVVEEGWNVEEW